jgi:hypothetical protein
MVVIPTAGEVFCFGRARRSRDRNAGAAKRVSAGLKRGARH